MYYNNPKNQSCLIIDLHIARIGWICGIYANEITTNPFGDSYNIEAIRLYFNNNNDSVNSFRYCSQTNDFFEKKLTNQGGVSGTVGKKTPITGFALYLNEEMEEKYEIFYRLADKNGKWSNWTHDGQKVSINAPVVDIAFKVIER